jgi:hypothetical protein
MAGRTIWKRNSCGECGVDDQRRRVEEQQPHPLRKYNWELAGTAMCRV